MSDTPTRPTPVMLFDASELASLMGYWSSRAQSAADNGQPQRARTYQDLAHTLRNAEVAYHALGDRAKQLEAQLAWVFRGAVVRNHLPITRADAEAHVAAETEDTTHA